MKQLLAWLPTPPLASVCTLQRENQHRAEEEEPKINTTIARSTGREVRAWAWHTHTHTHRTTTITGDDYLNGCGLLWPGRISFSLHALLLSPWLLLLFVQHLLAICNVPTCVCVCVCLCLYTWKKTTLSRCYFQTYLCAYESNLN